MRNDTQIDIFNNFFESLGKTIKLGLVCKCKGSGRLPSDIRASIICFNIAFTTIIKNKYQFFLYLDNLLISYDF